MKTYIVNVVSTETIPMVVDADNEWEAMVKVSCGEGYIHESGSHSTVSDSTEWQVEEFEDSLGCEFYEQWV